MRLNNDSLCQPSFKSLVVIIEVSLAQSKTTTKEKTLHHDHDELELFQHGREGIVVITFLSVLLK